MSETTPVVGEESSVEEGKGNFLTRCCPVRFILAVMGFWCFFVLSALRLNISLAIVAMVNWTELKSEYNKSTAVEGACNYSEREERSDREDGPFLWNPKLQGYILSSYFYGLAATQLAGGRVAELVSAKLVLLVGTMTATFCTFLIPLVADDGGIGVIVLQVFKGFGQGIMMPSFSVLMGKWIPPHERARFMSFIASGMPVGGFITVVISGYICKNKSLGWPFVFYVFGTIGALWCLFWGFLIYDSPLTHPYITKKELNRIMSLRTQTAPQLKVHIPLMAILTSKPVWAYIFVGFASFWALSLYVSVVPLFMGTILKYDIETNGLMSAVPNLVEAFFLVATSMASDYLLKRKILGATAIRKISISTGLCGYAMCMIIVTLTGCSREYSVAFLVLALGMSGFNFASTAVVPVDMTPRFAGTVSGIMNTFGALSGVAIPSIIGILTEKRQTMTEWSILFYASACICLASVITFITFGSSEKQPWNEPRVPPSAESEEREESEEGPAISSTEFPDEHRPSIIPIA